jgi:hypothetical protein
MVVPEIRSGRNIVDERIAKKFGKPVQAPLINKFVYEIIKLLLKRLLHRQTLSRANPMRLGKISEHPPHQVSSYPR